MMLRAGHIIYLSSLIKVVEHMSHAREIMREHMLKTEKNSTQISSFELRFDREMQTLKLRSIDTLLACHPMFFRKMIEFKDWPSAMEYLLNNKEAALKFWEAFDDR